MNIGIDVDGVLNDSHSFNLKHAPPFFKKKFNRDIVDENQYDIRDMFVCPLDEFATYWKKHLFAYTVFEPARKSAKKIIRSLRKDGHKIYIITKRVFTCREDFAGKLMRFLLKNWLWRNGIRYDEIIFCDSEIPDSKRTACTSKNIDIMIDDEQVNIDAIVSVARVICFDTCYNQQCEGENITRVYNWDEIYPLIK
ncbi:MAG: hypothetical protein FWD44_08235 [Oscillospiraceae bacterium]|nr:hypothetical protein [Oscillospiraceae bacterium]